MSFAPRGLAPRKGLEGWLMKRAVLGHWWSHAAGSGPQASLGTPVPRTPTVAPGPKARSDSA